MTLLEMSPAYQHTAAALHERIKELRTLERSQTDPNEMLRLRRRINELVPLWQEARDLADLTAHYYDRSYHKDEYYTL